MLKQVSPFSSLVTAGRELAPHLAAYENDPDAIVLGIALGGVPVAREVANFLCVPLDLVLIRRLLAPEGSDSLLCAVNVAGSMVLDDGIHLSEAPSTPIEHFLAEAVAELRKREQICRRGRAPIDLTGRTVLLVDCGIRSGSTMRTAIKSLREVRPKRIVAAVPVASPETFESIRTLADDSVCLAQPKNFGNAALWYEDFSRPDDDQVGGLLR